MKNTVTLFLFAHVLSNVAIASRVDRLERRLGVFEEKVFLDAKEFREDIRKIFEILNGTFLTNGGSLAAEANNASLKVISDKSCKDKVEDSRKCQDIAAMKRGFAAEKLRLKQYANILELGLQQIQERVSIDMELFAKGLGSVRSDLNDYCKYEKEENKRVSERLDSLESENKQMSALLAQMQQTLQNTHDIAVQSQLKNDATSEAVNRVSIKQTQVLDTLDRSAENLNKIFLELLLKITMKDNWRQYGDSYYYIGEQTASWAEAELTCESLGAHLAEVNSANEHDFLTNLINSDFYKGSLGLLWLGGNDIEEEGQWKWSHSNEIVQVSYCHANEPNGGTSENCVHMYTSIHYAGGKWNDSTCDSKYNFICENSKKM